MIAFEFTEPSSHEEPFSMADVVSVVGDKYTLMVLWETLLGVQRFNSIARNTGAPRDILAARLRKLVAAGLLERVPYQEHPVRHEYKPTQAGWDLQPVLIMLMQWGRRHLIEVPSHESEGERQESINPSAYCRADGGE